MADRVLVAVEDPGTGRAIQLAFERAGYEVAVVGNGLDAVELAIRDQPDAIVLDVSLPGIDGFEVLSRIRRHHRTMLTVVILLIDEAGSAHSSHGWRLEADDFVLKPVDPDDLVIRVTSRLGRMRAALWTSWPGLPNGAAIERQLLHALERGDDFALLAIDIDEFKAFNDRYGFVRGNQAIGLLARIVESVADDVAAGAFAGHVGGDDFVLITPAGIAERAATQVIGRFDRAVPGLYDREDREAGFVAVRDRTRRVRRHRLITLSIGIAVSTGRKYRHPAEVGQVAAEMEGVAKRDPFSSYRIDRRSPGGGAA